MTVHDDTKWCRSRVVVNRWHSWERLWFAKVGILVRSWHWHLRFGSRRSIPLSLFFDKLLCFPIGANGSIGGLGDKLLRQEPCPNGGIACLAARELNVQVHEQFGL